MLLRVNIGSLHMMENGPTTVYSEENLSNWLRIDYLAHIIKLISVILHIAIAC